MNWQEGELSSFSHPSRATDLTNGMTHYPPIGLVCISIYLSILRTIFGLTLFEKTRNTDLRHGADIDRVKTMLQRRRLRWLGHFQKMEISRLPKQLLVSKIEGGKRLQEKTESTVA